MLGVVITVVVIRKKLEEMDISKGSPQQKQKRGKSQQQGEVLVGDLILFAQGEENVALVAGPISLILP